jgi:hypothetical protein
MCEERKFAALGVYGEIVMKQQLKQWLGNFIGISCVSREAV